MKIHTKLWKRRMAAVMVCILMISTTDIQSIFAAEENINEEVVVNPEEIGEETTEEISVEENSARIDENLGGEIDINERIEKCEEIELDDSSVELKAGQLASLPAVELGDGFSSAITNNGDLYCWGINDSGQVGNGTTTNQTTPVKVLSNVASASFSRSSFYYNSGSMAAVTGNGDLYCWGANDYGQVGNGTKTNQTTPIKVLSNVASVSFSDSRFANSSVAAITGNGDLYCWGANEYGQIGNGTKTNQTTPVKVLSNVVSVSFCGSYYSSSSVAAITRNGDLYCWGAKANQTTPVKVLSNVASVSGYGSGLLAAITENGDLYCWGFNESGQVGNGTTTDQATPVKVLSNVAFVSGHDSGKGFGYNSVSMAAVTENGDLYCWGYNDYGQVGNGTTINQTTPVKVLNNVVSVYDYDYNSGSMAAITENGDLYCWGYNNYGQVGNGTTTDQTTPVKVLSNVAFVSGHEGSMAAITENGDLYCWGYNNHVQVGNGATMNQTTPVKVLSNVVSVYGPVYNSMAAVTENGDLYCWGANSFGQVGNGSTTYQDTPTKIMNLIIGGCDYSKKVQKMTVIPGSLELYVGGSAKQLKVSNAKGKVTYKNSNPKVIKINSKGKVTPLSKGKATITVTAAGNATYKTAFKKISVTVYGKPAKVKSVKAIPGKSKRTLTVSWKKVSSVSGYIIKYSYNKNMKNSKTIKVNSGSSTLKTIKKLTSKKYVYIQVQAYKKDGKTQIKGTWSAKVKSKGKIK